MSNCARVILKSICLLLLTSHVLFAAPAMTGTSLTDKVATSAATASTAKTNTAPAPKAEQTATTANATSTKQATPKKTSTTNKTANDKVMPLDRIVAIVNDDIITQSDLDAQVKLVEHQLSRTNTPAPKKSVLQHQVLDHMIDQTLQLQLAKKLGIEIDTAELNSSIARIAKGNNLTLSQFHQALRDDGLSYVIFRKDVREQMLVERVQQKVIGPKITISKQEVDNYLRTMSNEKIPEYHLSSIYIALPEVPSPAQVQAAEQKVNNIMLQLKQGASFPQTAIAESDGPNALQGGDLGWKRAAQIPQAISKQVDNDKPGALIGPIRTPNGILILKLNNKRIVTDKHFITQTHARHILIKTNALVTDADARATLLKLRSQIEKGANFSDVAKKYSQGPSASKGGDLGWVSPGMLVPPFEQAMDKLQPGQISMPVHTQYGWHIIQVLARKQKDITAQYRQNQVRQYIYQRKFQEQVQTWLNGLHQEGFIKIMLQVNPTKAVTPKNIKPVTIPQPKFVAPKNSKQKSSKEDQKQNQVAAQNKTPKSDGVQSKDQSSAIKSSQQSDTAVKTNAQ